MEKKINKYSYFFVSPFWGKAAATCSGQGCDPKARGQIPNPCKAAQSRYGGLEPGPGCVCSVITGDLKDDCFWGGVKFSGLWKALLSGILIQTRGDLGSPCTPALCSMLVYPLSQDGATSPGAGLWHQMGLGATAGRGVRLGKANFPVWHWPSPLLLG